MRSTYRMATYQMALLLFLFLTAINVVAQNKDFRVFDGTLFRNKPSMTQYGLEPIGIVYPSPLWNGKGVTQSLPARSTVRREALKAARVSPIVIIDIEHWRLRDVGSQWSANMAKYEQVAKWAKSDIPAAKIGYFSVLPWTAYAWSLQAPGSWEYKQWIEENERRRSLAALVDVICPHLYTHHVDPTVWKETAVRHIEAARKYGKPVYVFLWPQFEQPKRLNQEFLPPSYWRLQLETVYRHADGVVIWGGWDGKTNSPARWDPNADWWMETVDFITQIRTSDVKARPLITP